MNKISFTTREDILELYKSFNKLIKSMEYLSVFVKNPNNGLALIELSDKELYVELEYVIKGMNGLTTRYKAIELGKEHLVQVVRENLTTVNAKHLATGKSTIANIQTIISNNNVLIGDFSEDVIKNKVKSINKNKATMAYANRKAKEFIMIKMSEANVTDIRVGAYIPNLVSMINSLGSELYMELETKLEKTILSNDNDVALLKATLNKKEIYLKTSRVKEIIPEEFDFTNDTKELEDLELEDMGLEFDLSQIGILTGTIENTLPDMEARNNQLTEMSKDIENITSVLLSSKHIEELIVDMSKGSITTTYYDDASAAILEQGKVYIKDLETTLSGLLVLLKTQNDVQTIQEYSNTFLEELLIKVILG